MSIIKPCDIRGRFPEELDMTTALALGRALGARIGSNKVVVAGDVRLSTPALKDALTEGLVASGSKVLDLGIVPTPLFYYGRTHLDVHNGVMVTASHNPAGYNGFKITVGENPIEEEELQELARQMEEGLFRPREGGSVVSVDLFAPYIAHTLAQHTGWIEAVVQTFAGGGSPKSPSEMRVIVDCGNGSNSLVAVQVLEQAGFDVEALYCTPDGAFPNREPNPAVSTNLAELSRRVVAHNAQLGIAFDGDGDRVAFVDRHGNSIETDRSLALFSHFFASQKPETPIVYDIKCSMIVPQTIEKAQGIPLVERSGHTYIRSTLLNSGSAFGGELSGHCFFGTLGYDDALLAALLFSTIMHHGGSAMLDALPHYPSTPDLRIPYPFDDRHTILDELYEKLSGRSDFVLDRIDGVRATRKTGWALARPSVTEPLLTFRFEGESEDELQKIRTQFLSAVPKLEKLVDEYLAERSN